MGVLDQVMQMKNQGMSESEIINNLQEQRIPPKEINDALMQSQIKSAVSGPQNHFEENPTDTYQPEAPMPQDYYNQEDSFSETQDYSAPQIPIPNQEIPQEQNYAPQTQDYYNQEDYGYSSSSTATDTDTIIEISEQVVSEKIKDLQKQIDKFTEFSTIANTKIINMLERIKKLENTIDKLQLSILDKVGSYGSNLESIKKEMSMMQESFSKTKKSKTKK